MLEFKNITKKFGRVTALENINLKVQDGEFIFITGASGSGKTTLLRLILREILPDEGEIIFDGEDLTKLPENKIPKLRQQFGVVFQDFKVLSERTVRENVELPLAVLNLPKSEWQVRVDHVLKLVGLQNRSEFFPSQLAGGELQRVSMARAFVVNPKIILADEPTGNLDWNTADNIIDLFEKINKEGKTVLMVTHNELIINRLKKRTIVLESGKLISDKEGFVKPVDSKIEDKQNGKLKKGSI